MTERTGGAVAPPDAVRLLLVDDTANVHLTLTAMLAMRPGGRGASRRYKVDQVHTVEEGLETIARAEHACYLVDHRVGEKSGVEMIRAARSAGLTAPIIMLTATEMVESQAAEAGANDFLVKGGFDTATLERSIRYAIGNAEMLRGMAAMNATLEDQVLDRTRQYLEANQALSEQIAARERAEAALLRASTLEALGRMTGQVAHDFNNVLTALFGSLELVRKRLGTGLDPRIDRPLEQAQEAARRAERMVEGLLAFARRRPIAPTRLDVNALIEASRDMLRMIAPPAVHLRFELSPDLPPILADRDQLERALVNLVGNAADAVAGRGTGRVVVSTRFEAQRSDLLVSVADNGTGMSEEVLARAFEPLFSTKEEGRGTGLGLAQVYGFTQSCGGDAEIDNRPGEGVTITMRLPAGAEPEPVLRDRVAEDARRTA